eukprot:scaffold110015_cov36-Tisochrysis_lutea.AAC.4
MREGDVKRASEQRGAREAPCTPDIALVLRNPDSSGQRTTALLLPRDGGVCGCAVCAWRMARPVYFTLSG